MLDRMKDVFGRMFSSKVFWIGIGIFIVVCVALGVLTAK